MKKYVFLLLPILAGSTLAGCQAQYYTVTWINDDESVLQVNEGVGANVHPAFDHDVPSSGLTPEEGHSYSFAGWKDLSGVVYDDHYVVTDHNVTLKAVYDELANSYEARWHNDDDALIDVSTFEYGACPKHVDPDPAKEPQTGYRFVFDCWIDGEGNQLTPEYKMPAKAVDFKAVFKEEANLYDVHWINDDNLEIDVSHVAYGQNPTHAEPESSKEEVEGHHYAFVGWKDQNGTAYSEDYLMPDRDVIFFAQYKLELNEYTITWLDDDESVIDTTVVKYQENPTHVNPTKEPEGDYVFYFDGWYEGTTKVDADYKVSHDAAFVAKYSRGAKGGCVYKENGDGTYGVSAADLKHPSKKFEVLDEFNGKPVTSILDKAFFNTKAEIESIVIGNNVETIGTAAFKFLDSLNTVSLDVDASRLTTIGEQAFYSADFLSSFVAPKSLKTICNDAFTNAHFFTTLDLSNVDSVVMISGSPFTFVSDLLKIYVKESLLDEYLNESCWEKYADKIVAKN